MSSAIADLYPWDTLVLVGGLYAGLVIMGLLACAIDDWWHR